MVSGNRRKEYSAAAPATQTNNGQTYNMMMMLMSISKLQNDNCGYTECHSVQGTRAGAYNIMNEENSQNKIRSLKQKRAKYGPIACIPSYTYTKPDCVHV